MQVPRSALYRCWLDDEEHCVVDSVKAHVVRAAGDSHVQVTIACQQPIESVVVRPLALGIKPTHDGAKISFTLETHASISIEINDDLNAPLLLFWDAPVQTPEPDATTTIFRAGEVHNVGELVVASEQRIFLEGGAVVRGQLKIDRATNVRVWGPGILDQSTRTVPMYTVHVRHSSNVILEDILLLDTYGWSLHLEYSNHIDINRVRIIGTRGNSDGIDVVSSSHVAIRNCFLKTLDDCIAIKSGNFETEDSQTMEDVVVTNSVMWNEIPGNAMEVGFELNNRLVKGIHFNNCDIIHVLRGAAFSIHNSGGAHVEDVSFENIRLEDVRDEFVDLYIGLSIYSKDCPHEFFRLNPDRRPVPQHRRDNVSPDNSEQWLLATNAQENSQIAAKRGSISNVRFRNIRFVGGPIRIVIKGYDEAHAISNVSFSDISCDGNAMSHWPQDMVRIEHAKDVVFAGQDMCTTAAHTRPMQ